MVYHHLYVKNQIVDPFSKPDSPVNFLRTNSKVSVEAIWFLYGCNCFKFALGAPEESDREAFQKLLATIGPQNAAFLRSICIQIPKVRSNIQDEKLLKQDETMPEKLIAEFPNLQTVTLAGNRKLSTKSLSRLSPTQTANLMLALQLLGCFYKPLIKAEPLLKDIIVDVKE